MNADEVIENQCYVCKNETKLVCSKCQHIKKHFICSSKCQKKDWPIHKLTCSDKSVESVESVKHTEHTEPIEKPLEIYAISHNIIRTPYYPPWFL